MSSDASEKSAAQSPPPNRDELPSEKPAPKPADEIPDGGIKAWLQVLGSFILFMNSW
jgi:hypothetical protein